MEADGNFRRPSGPAGSASAFQYASLTYRLQSAEELDSSSEAPLAETLRRPSIIDGLKLSGRRSCGAVKGSGFPLCSNGGC